MFSSRLLRPPSPPRRRATALGGATATFPDGQLPDVQDVVRVAANVFSAGQETTVRLLSAALQVIAEQPAIQQSLRAEPARIPNFIEEALRAESPVKGDFRLARVPVTVGGVDLPAGTTVMVVNGAANRDPRRFPEPATFHPDRPLDRTASITISEQAHGPADERRYHYVPTYILRGLTRLHLEFTLSGEAAR
jgi:cytochrome P450 family 150 subfamily A5